MYMYTYNFIVQCRAPATLSGANGRTCSVSRIVMIRIRSTMFCTSSPYGRHCKCSVRHTHPNTQTHPLALSRPVSPLLPVFCFRFLTSLLRSSRRNALLVSFISYSCLHRISLIHICFSSCFRLPSCSLFSPPKPMAACRPAPT